METDLTDHEILLRLRRGDASALDAILNANWSQLVRYVSSMGVDSDTAEDIAQQAFVRLWELGEDLR